jgi:mRNA interferase MazF
MIRLTPSADNQLTKTSAADTFQIRSASKDRLIRKIGLVDRQTMKFISQALTIVLDLGKE